MIILTLSFVFFILYLSSFNMCFLLLLPMCLLFLKPQKEIKIEIVCDASVKVDEYDIDYIFEQIKNNKPKMYSFKHFSVLAKLNISEKPIYKINCLNKEDFKTYKDLSVKVFDLKEKIDFNFVVVTNSFYAKDMVADYVINVEEVDFETVATINAFNINYPLVKRNKYENFDLLGEIDYSYNMSDYSIVYSVDEGKIKRLLNYKSNSVYTSFNLLIKKRLNLIFANESLYYVQKEVNGYSLLDLYGKNNFYIITRLKYLGGRVSDGRLLFEIMNGFIYLTTQRCFLSEENIIKTIKTNYDNVIKIEILNEGFSIFNKLLPHKIIEQYFKNPRENIYSFKNFVYGFKSEPCDISKINLLIINGTKDLSSVYNYFKHDIFGIYANDKYVKVAPKIGFNLNVKLKKQDKTYVINLVHNGQSQVQISGTKYHNMNIFKYDWLDKIEKISF